jgi:hypothetical protein
MTAVGLVPIAPFAVVGRASHDPFGMFTFPKHTDQGHG